MLPYESLDVVWLVQLLAEKRHREKLSYELKVCRNKLTTRDKLLQVQRVTKLTSYCFHKLVCLSTYASCMQGPCVVLCISSQIVFNEQVTVAPA